MVRVSTTERRGFTHHDGMVGSVAQRLRVDAKQAADVATARLDADSGEKASDQG